MGAISLILHAHLPAVAGTPVEFWFHEALLGCYLPLTEVLRRARGPARLTLSISPPLIDMLTDAELLVRARAYIAAHCALAEQARAPELSRAAEAVARRSRAMLALFDELDGDLLTIWRDVRDAGRVELGTCAGTHAILPLLHTVDFRRMHIEHACERFAEHFGSRPRFMWLPECGFAPGVDALLNEAGVWATVVEARAFGEATVPPLHGKYAPVITENVAAFARDPESSARVWSGETGYPGDAAYREFHRDAGYDSPEDAVPDFIVDGERIPSAVKLWRVTGHDVSLDAKEPWDPDLASHTAARHADHFLRTIAADLGAASEEIGRPAHLCCAFDAELFGHWWYEGPTFLEEVLARSAEHEVDLVTPSDYLAAGPSLQVSRPAISTWGANGDFSWWVDESTTWIIPLLHTAEDRWLDARRRDGQSASLAEAARELMSAQASDWPFAIRGVRYAGLARRQIAQHVIAFDRLLSGRAGS